MSIELTGFSNDERRREMAPRELHSEPETEGEAQACSCGPDCYWYPFTSTFATVAAFANGF